jgi:D-lyxose ketol-isomerase
MRRSEIDAIIDETLDVFAREGVVLPPFAHWTPGTWRAKGEATRTMRERCLGWNVVAFEPGRFERSGIVVFTTRMGDHRGLAAGKGRLYGEKVILVREGQRVPYHFHKVKTEDFFNRGGGTLEIDLLRIGADGGIDDTPFLIDRDGLLVEARSGETLRLAPGEGVTLDPGIAHAFRAEGGDVVCGEISLVNDDATDNYFVPPLPPAPPIEEDAPARRLVVADYAKL